VSDWATAAETESGIRGRARHELTQSRDSTTSITGIRIRRCKIPEQRGRGIGGKESVVDGNRGARLVLAHKSVSERDAIGLIVRTLRNPLAGFVRGGLQIRSH